MNENNSPIITIKHCTIPAKIPIQIYHCYDDEECCEYGCCTKTVQHLYQTWYFWFLISLVFLAIVATCWAYKRNKRTALPIQEQETRPRRRVHEFIMEAIREENGEPPSYSAVMAKTEAFCAPPPDYNSVTAEQ